MKNFKRFAIALVAVVIVLFIGLAFRRIWGPVVFAFIDWICNVVGIDTPAYLNSVLNKNYVSGKSGTVGDNEAN